MKPIFINDSKVPLWVGKLTKMNIWAVSFGIWVWCRGTIGSITRRHETIHFKQQLELLFVFQWILYGLFWLIGLVIYGTSKEAYRKNPFEREAYMNQLNTYDRKLYSWIKYFWWKDET